MKIKKIIITFVCCAILGVIGYVLFSFYYLFFIAWAPEYKYFEITSPINNDSLFVKKKNWGMTYDHQIVFISSQPKQDDEYNPHYDYMYRGLQGLLYKVSNDTVYIYASTLSPTPDSFSSQLVIIQVEIYYDKMHEFQKDSYKKGMTRISNY
ncbi:MAG: hypothetical protein GY865_12075 [candidate division Zixibacteria bacterium]|nr:hypothetical protein [candidate division Zixibacteria bacterium]